MLYKLKSRTLYAAASLSSMLVLAAAFWLEAHYMLSPCPLCMLQRVMLMIISACFILLYFFGHKFFQVPLILSALAGIALSGRQIWLQSTPNIPSYSCGGGLQQLIHKYPLLDFVKVILHGNGECSQIDYTILGWSLAWWSLLVFMIVALVGVWQLIKKEVVF